MDTCSKTCFFHPNTKLITRFELEHLHQDGVNFMIEYGLLGNHKSRHNNKFDTRIYAANNSVKVNDGTDT